MAKGKPNPLQPSAALLCKLGSAIVHADEYLTPGQGHPVDKQAFQGLLADAEVKEWLDEMGPMIPRKRELEGKGK